MQRIERKFAGRNLTLEIGRMAKQAQGSCYVQFGETAILVAATVQHRTTHLPFFPMTVEYREKTYAAGKFPGGFIKRETRPSEKEILAARLTDRPLRPLFPKGFMNEVQIIATVMSINAEVNPDIPAMLGTSAALALYQIMCVTTGAR